MGSLVVGIIGTSNRNVKLLKDELEAVYDSVEKEIMQLLELKGRITLCSGGSTGADHLAVLLYLRLHERYLEKLSFILELPCGFDVDDGKFIHQNQYQKPSCQMLNYLHNKFRKETGMHSINDLSEAIKSSGVTINVSNGFFARNEKIAAESDYLIAISKGPISGGTKYTWERFRGERRLISL